MATGRLSRVDRLARIFGYVLIVLGVSTFATSFSSGEAPSDIDIGFKVWLAMAGIATVFAIRKKTIMRRVIAGLTNGFMCSIAIWMFFATADDPARPVKLVLGGFLLVACGLSVAASLLATPRAPHSDIPDIIKRRSPSTD
jgi:hypothetical protein